MNLFSFFALFIFYAFCDTVFSYYIQAKRFDYDPSPILMYNQVRSNQNLRPFLYETDRSSSDEEDSPPFWAPLADGISMMSKRRVTADQINSLLKNAWFGR